MSSTVSNAGAALESKGADAADALNVGAGAAASAVSASGGASSSGATGRRPTSGWADALANAPMVPGESKNGRKRCVRG